MANKRLNARIVLRNDTKAQWASANPILLKGEIGIEFDPNATAADRTILFKIGDGVTYWNDLPYGGGDFAEVIAELQRRMTAAEGDIDTLESTVGNLANDLTAEISRATAAEASLRSDLTAAETAISAVEGDITTIQGNITTLSGNISSLAGDLATEVSRATGAEAALQGSLQAAVTRIDSLEPAVSANTAAIATLNAAASVSGSVAHAVSVEESRAIGRENAIAADLATEHSRATAAEAALSTRLSTAEADILALQGNHFEVVASLPASGANNIIYLVPKPAPATGYKEWIWINNNAWEEIGDTDVDLSNYYTKAETNASISSGIAAANSYADTAASNAYGAAVSVSAAALTSAIADEVSRANGAYIANSDVLILDCGTATTNYSAS